MVLAYFSTSPLSLPDARGDVVVEAYRMLAAQGITYVFVARAAEGLRQFHFWHELVLDHS